MGSSEASKEELVWDIAGVEAEGQCQEGAIALQSVKGVEGQDSGILDQGIAHGTRAGGLTSEELQELHKTNPKKVKRILANRSSAARSKVRKLRYIAELDSKAAILHQQVSDMTVELRTLQESTARLGAENDWLHLQMLGLEAQSLRMDHETETLQMHIRQRTHALQGFPPPLSLQNSALTQYGPSLETPVALPKDAALAQRRQAVIPPSVFQATRQDQTLRFSPNLTGQTPSDSSLRAAAPWYSNLPCLPANLQTEQPNFVKEQLGLLPTGSLGHGPPYYSSKLPGLSGLNDAPNFNLEKAGHNLVSLHSFNSSEGSGMSSTTQEMQLDPEDPALLSLLRSIDLGRWETRDPAVAPLPPASSLARYDRSRSSVVTTPRRHLFPQGGSIQVGPGSRGLGAASAALQSLGVAGSVSLPSHSNPAALTSAAQILSMLQDPTNHDLSVAQGLGRWPRHFSDPHGYQRGL